MSEIKIRRTETAGDCSSEVVFEGEGLDYLHEDLIKALFGAKAAELAQGKEMEVKIAELDVKQPGVEGDVVAIYDNAGIPSFMHRFTRVSNKELFGGSDKPHPAFVIGGEVYDEIYISVYQNCEINGKPYSLPYQEPWTNIANDEAAKACFSKGEGWHMMTMAEWGLLANLSLKNGTLPHGNTNNGRDYNNPKEMAEAFGEDGKTKTGSGPETWTHNHKVTGVHDLCGNVWEMVRGLRIKDGMLEAAKNNDAAMVIDLTQEGDCWQRIRDNSGNIVRVSVKENDIHITTNSEAKQGFTGASWNRVQIECESEQLKELALFAGEPEACLCVDSMDGEWFPICGGSRSSASRAGVFNISIDNPRFGWDFYNGFRAAYYRKLDGVAGKAEE